jgi:hypothetical protein
VNIVSRHNEFSSNLKESSGQQALSSACTLKTFVVSCCMLQSTVSLLYKRKLASASAKPRTQLVKIRHDTKHADMSVIGVEMRFKAMSSVEPHHIGGGH